MTNVKKAMEISSRFSDDTLREIDAILSIKPQFVEEIISGRKTYEFRKKVFKERVRNVYIYASSPVRRIIGEFKIGQILKGQPDYIWENTRNHAGIAKKYFYDYYKGREVAYAIEIKKLKVYNKTIDPFLLFERFTPPQSFRYVRAGSFVSKI